MAAGIDPPANVFVHGWLLIGGEKLSKTLLREAAARAAQAGGAGAGAAETGADAGGGDTGEDGGGDLKLTEIAPWVLTRDFGVDATRYHLLRDVPLGADGDFSYEGMTGRYNADLANNLGNLMQRVARVVSTKCGGVGPAPAPDSRLAAVAREAVSSSAAAWERFAPHEALEATWRLIGAANAELEATEPWRAEPGPAVDAVMGSVLEVLRIVALLVSPAMPDAAAELWRRIGLEGLPSERRLPADAAWGGYPGGRQVEEGPALFPRRRA
jgi:methionyl-tRNA synthetase